MVVIDHSSRKFAAEELYVSKRDTPKIGGSYGGFVALVVCLVLVILISCSATFYLLRYHEPSDDDRAARRRRRQQQQQGSSQYAYDASTTPAPSWLSRITRLFAGKDRKSRGLGRNMKLGRGGRRGGGWTQAGSGDEWDSDSGDEEFHAPRSRSAGMGQLSDSSASQQAVSYSGSGQPLDEPFRPPIQSLSPSESTSTVRFDMHSVPNLSYDSRNSASLPSVQARMTSPTSTSLAESYSPIHPRTLSPEQDSRSGSPDTPEREGRHDSASTSRTFSSGTKFIEAL